MPCYDSSPSVSGATHSPVFLRFSMENNWKLLPAYILHITFLPNITLWSCEYLKEGGGGNHRLRAAFPFLTFRYCNPSTYYRGWLTPWSSALFEKPPVAQPLKNFSTFYETRRFNTVFTIALQCSLHWGRSIRSIPPHPISVRSILILSCHQRLSFPSNLPFGFSTKILHALLFVLPISSFLTWSF
jgi:hypothetical protein